MYFKINSFFLLSFLYIQFKVLRVASSDPKDVTVSVFYESKSKEAIMFFQHQLLPVFRELGDYFVIRFVPFGKSEFTYDSKRDMYFFTCEHGHDECLYNMYHACALRQIQDRYVRAGFIGCLMTSEDEKSILCKCCSIYRVKCSKIKQCVYNRSQGNNLLAGYGNETKYYFPNGIEDIPSITVNGIFKKQDQHLALNNFKRFVCKNIKFYASKEPECCEED